MQKELKMLGCILFLLGRLGTGGAFFIFFQAKAHPAAAID
jgi:hypothetical protein